MFVCHYSNVRTLTSPPVLKLWDSQGYLWLPYNLMEVIKLIEKRLEPKNIFFQKNTLCHSFRIIVIPSGLLSFLPDFFQSFHIFVIPSKLVSFLLKFVILNVNTSSTLPYPKGEKNGHQRWPYMRVDFNFGKDCLDFKISSMYNSLISLQLWKFNSLKL